MNFSRFEHVFFLGAGGIGMSALARFFNLIGKKVSGYDRTSTALTQTLQNEGINIFFEDDCALIPDSFNHPAKTLVILTPAIKEDNQLYQHFKNNGFEIVKRSQVLGLITAGYKTIAVAGTHGKTTVSSMVAHLLYQSKVGCTAFLGGIAKNYQTNFLFSEKSSFAVAEADEFDRSFLQLHPLMAVITSADADHLDIYGTEGQMKDTFSAFAGQVLPEGFLLLKHGLNLNYENVKARNSSTYALDDCEADNFASNIRIKADSVDFDLNFDGNIIEGIELGITGLMNVENAVAAAVLALKAGISEKELKTGFKTFGGINRRFDVRFKSDKIVYIDDYAHHPEEIKALVKSVRSVYPGRSVTGIFQPHLFSRTRDFAEGFAESLGLLDEIILLEIYPAREKPVEGVTSLLIFEKIENPKKCLCSKNDLPAMLEQKSLDILLTIGAGDIDQLVRPIQDLLVSKQQHNNPAL